MKVRAFAGQRNAKPNLVVLSLAVNLSYIPSHGSREDYIISIGREKTHRGILVCNSCVGYRFCRLNLLLRDSMTSKGRKDGLGKEAVA